MAFTMVTLTVGAGYRTALGDVPLTRIRATPLVEMTNGVKTVAQEVIMPIAANGSTTRTLAATTDPATTPAGNAYSFVVESDGRPVRQFVATVPHNAGSTVAVDSLVALTSPPNLTSDYSLVVLTQAAYSALAAPDAHTLYVVIG